MEKTKTIKPVKTKKPRADKYEEKLKINGTFEQLMKELLTPVKTTK